MKKLITNKWGRKICLPRPPYPIRQVIYGNSFLYNNTSFLIRRLDIGNYV
nr:MAG TPA: hypothetical protein [Caudoviricetes sp.]